MSVDELFTREEALSGLPAQRARTLLYLLESLTAQRVARSRQAMAPYVTEAAAEERELAFLQAFAQGADPPLKPSIQDLERHAGDWAALVPPNPRLQAVLAHLLGQKYPLSFRAVPGIRKALALDSEAVRRAYQRQYNQPLEAIFRPQPTPLERLRWAANRLSGWLDNLPPFWTAFSLTLTETVGASILALPIALAEVGPLAGIAFLVLLGLVNVITVIYMSETLTRTGSVRFGSAYLGRIVSEYLGSAGVFIFSAALALLIFLVLIAFYVGIATTLEAATRLPAAFWALLVFLAGLYFIRRENLNATITTALLVGAANILLILALCALALPYVRAENLAYINLPFLAGRPFEPSILKLVFGIILAAFFGHTAIANCARIVLQREPSGRALIGGSSAAQVAAILLYSLWLLAVNGSIDPGLLASQPGTSLVPLAAQAGPLVNLFGTVFVMLGMGMVSIHFSLGMYNLVRERLPNPHSPLVILPRRRGTLIFRSREGRDGSLRAGLVYLGTPAGRPRFRLEVQAGEGLQRLETEAEGEWDAGHLLGRLAGGRFAGVPLSIEILEASPHRARLRISTPLSIRYEGEWDSSGIELAGLLDLPEEKRRILNWVLRQGVADPARIAAQTGQEESRIKLLLDELALQGYLTAAEADGQAGYQASIAVKRGRQLPPQIWQALGGEAGPPSRNGRVERSWRRFINPRSRFLLGITPLVLVFLLVEWQLLTRSESFTEPLNFAGTIIVSLIGGVFPALLLHSSRRKGEIVPGRSYRLLGHPLFIAGIYLLYLASLLLHGLVIWQDPVQRAVALLTGGLMLLATWRIARQGGFSPRAVVELRHRPGDEAGAQLSVTARGEPAETEVRLKYRDSEQVFKAAWAEIPALSALRAADFHLPAGIAREVKVWAHQVSPQGDSESLPANVEVVSGGEVRRQELKLSNGQAVIPLGDGPSLVRVELPET